jgi:D-glycero-D-manno-heptose 1,7-bisphosphate phosphatase
MIRLSKTSFLTHEGYAVDIKNGVLSFRRRNQVPAVSSPTVFRDRDGVLNRHIVDGYVTRWDDFVILPGVPAALRRLRIAGFRLVIVSNQAGVAKEFLSCDELIHITSMSLRKFEEAGAVVDAAFFCLHHPKDNSTCRKPKPGLLRLAAHFFPTDFGRSFLIGDSLSDVLAGALIPVQGWQSQVGKCIRELRSLEPLEELSNKNDWLGCNCSSA